MEIHPLIKKRISIRAFADKAVENEALLSLIEAARWAPSSNNEQPWRFIVIKKNEPSFQKLLSCLTSKNKTWAVNAAAFIIVAAKIAFSYNSATNLHAYHDTGLAIGNLTLQATWLDIYLHQLAGFYHEKIKETFEIPGGFEPVNVIALGYKGNPETLPAEYKEKETMPRLRKSLNEILYSEKFNHPSNLI